MPKIIRKIKLPGDIEPRVVYDERINKQISSSDSGKVIKVNSNGTMDAATINEVPSSGLANQVLTKTTNGYAWQDAQGGTGTVKTINGKGPDGNGNVEITVATESTNGLMGSGDKVKLNGLTQVTESTVSGWGFTKNTGTVTTTGTMTSSHVVISNGGTVIKDSGYTIAKSVPSDAVFTDTKPNDGALTLQVAGTTKATFTADDADNVTFNVTAADLGLSQALVFKGITTTNLTDGATTSPITLDGGGSLTPAVGNVVITSSSVSTWPNTEFVWANSKWNKLGDAKSYALNSVTVTGTGALGGGGNLSANRTITHNAGNAASKSAGLYKISTDAYSHVSSVTAVTKEDITNLGIPGSDTNTTYSLTQDSTDGHKITLTPSSGTAQTITIPDNNTTYTAGTGLTLSGTQFKHSNSVTAGTASEGGSARTLAFGGTFNVPSVTYDAQGHVTGKGSTTLTMPANPNTDTKNTAGSTDTSSKIFLVGATAQAANPQTYSDNQVYATNGQLNGNSVRVAEAVSLVYDSTNKCLNFNFA